LNDPPGNFSFKPTVAPYVGSAIHTDITILSSQRMRLPSQHLACLSHILSPFWLRVNLYLVQSL
jgi:hypothetical protein